MGEFTVVNVSRPLINQNTIIELRGVSFHTLRKASKLLWAACTELKMPMTGYTMAMLYFQRLTLLNPRISREMEYHEGESSFSMVNICSACITSVLLTGENFKKVSDVMEVVHRQAQPNTSISTPVQTKSPSEFGAEGSDGINFVRENITSVNNLQREILETNCFDMTVTSAHIALITIAKALRKPVEKSVVHLAWKLCTDAYETPAVLRFRDLDVGASCLELAIRSQNSEIKAWGQETKPNITEWVPLRTSTKYLLEHLSKCEKLGLTTHSQINLSEELKQWLESLERTAPPAHKFHGDTSVWVRDSEASKNGTVRFQVE